MVIDSSKLLLGRCMVLSIFVFSLNSQYVSNPEDVGTLSGEQLKQRKIKVGLIVDEFFGGAYTPFGGYGFLARKFIAKYIPNEKLEIDVLFGQNKKEPTHKEYHEDNVTLYKLPGDVSSARKFLKEKNYDVYLSVELTFDFVLKCEPDKRKKLILLIQDPRPKYVWDEIINTMQSVKDPYFYKQSIYDTAHKWAVNGRVKFVSQGNSLNSLAMELYRLPKNTSVQYLPNPIDIDFEYQFNISNKKKQVVFLGRLETQKRFWLFCEIAKLMPEYEFYVVGRLCRKKKMNEKMLNPYTKASIPNLHFEGHLVGEEKADIIKKSRILVSTSIWEGIPVSWLEALSYGTLIVSNLEREQLVERFGSKVPDLLGDGFDGVHTFVPVIRDLMENDEVFSSKAKSAIEYVRETHNIPRFTSDLRKVIISQVNAKT